MTKTQSADSSYILISAILLHFSASVEHASVTPDQPVLSLHSPLIFDYLLNHSTARFAQHADHDRWPDGSAAGIPGRT
jgi:hypothetical protein